MFDLEYKSHAVSLEEKSITEILAELKSLSTDLEFKTEDFCQDLAKIQQDMKTLSHFIWRNHA